MYNSNNHSGIRSDMTGQGGGSAAQYSQGYAQLYGSSGMQSQYTNINGGSTSAVNGNPMSMGGPPMFSGLSGSIDNQYSSDMNSRAGGSDIPQLSKGILAAFGTLGYPGEPLLLEELDVNFSHIKTKTLAVLNPLRTKSKITSYNATHVSSSSNMTGFGNYIQPDQNMKNVNILNDADLAGPIFFALVYGMNLLLAGKVHFGYIYGCWLLGTLSIYLLFKMMSNNDSVNFSTVPVSSFSSLDGGSSGVSSNIDSSAKIQDLDYTRTASLIGYCLLPLILLSLFGIFVNLDNIMGYVLSMICTLWASYAASGLFILILKLEHSRFLIAYPLFLFYSVFALMAIFVEKDI